MKRENIDKKIGMPNVDAEWRKFERDVIGRKKVSRKAFYWEVGIAVSIVLAAGIFLFSHDTELPKQPKIEQMIAAATKPDGKISKKRTISNKKKRAISNKRKSATSKAKRSPSTKRRPSTTTSYEQIPGLETIMKTAPIGHGGTMRLRGSSPLNAVRDTALFIIDGKPHIMPLKERWGLCGIERDLYHRNLLIDSVEIYKHDSKTRPYIEKYGEAAKGGVVIIKTAPDTLCDAYVRQHPELMQSRHRVEGYVVDAVTEKPLANAWIRIGNSDTGAATNSAGHFILWLPSLDTQLRVYSTGYQDTDKIQPASGILKIRMKSNTGITMRLGGGN